MTNHKKVAVLARELNNRLSIRLAQLATALFTFQTFDSSSNGLIGIAPTAAEAGTGGSGVLSGNGTAGHQDAVLRIAELPSLGTNAVGNSQDSYGPHVLEMVIEASSTSGLGLLKDVNRLPIFGEVLRLATRVDLFLSNNGTAPAPTLLPTSPGSQKAPASSTFIASLDWLYFNPMVSM